MMIMMYISMLMVIIGCLSFVSKRTHLLVVLLSLEFIMLNLYWLMNLMFLIMNKEMFIVFIFLTFIVCEASIGLSLLVSMIRSHGNENVSNLSVMC